MDRTDIEFQARVEALGEDASEEQGKRLAQWVVENYGRDFWYWAAQQAVLVPGCYTELTMRCGECGIYR